ncbi:NADH-cytochrome b5 reductase 1 [Gracilariopsis chorda]|uniref:cytochrome-b5 reductase n=1 Tax=Gracilariopsis chorda TaxID=448386 RepID=A0A2V3IFC6_9FLOR|nr:NADH-cytochrome b5 reductase 1 [Gracilariopsis chorda]|eukprot:PXF40795.1 NADH-cytochrome b5 reductase 1 [Gracilariopsis chorda]
MASIIDQAIDYARENPGVVAGTCLAVLVIGVTQIVLTTASTSTSGALTTTYEEYPLLEKRRVSHNTRIFRFALPSENAKLGLPLGRHISLRTVIDGKEVRRPYTPISPEDCRGYFELMLKIYPAPHGLMSRYLDSLRIGEAVDVRGPLGKFSYTRNAYRRMNMVCGGTGITPMWQVFRAILSDPGDTTEISLVFANVTEDDVLLRDELDEIARTERRFSVYYVLNNPPSGWDGGVGFVTKDILEDRFGKPDDHTLVLMCGPPPMNKAMKAIVAEMGYPDSQVFKF